jgi:ABC-type transport system involved in cytochrome c biogenesis permease subunit
MVVMGASATVGMLVFQGHVDLLLGAHILTVTVGYCLAFVIGGLGMACSCLGLARGSRGAPRAGLSEAVSLLSLAGTVFVGVGVGLGMIWAKRHLGRYWAWDPKEMGGLIVFLWLVTLRFAQHWGLRNERLMMMMGIVGSFLTSVAWFDAGLLTVGSYPYGYSRIMVSPAGLVAFHAVFLLLGVLPQRSQAIVEPPDVG